MTSCSGSLLGIEDLYRGNDVAVGKGSFEGSRESRVIPPDLFRTPMVENSPRELQDALAAQVAYPSRMGLQSEFADLVTSICENEILNDETIRLDGSLRTAPVRLLKQPHVYLGWRFVAIDSI